MILINSGGICMVFSGEPFILQSVLNGVSWRWVNLWARSSSVLINAEQWTVELREPWLVVFASFFMVKYSHHDQFQTTDVMWCQSANPIPQKWTISISRLELAGCNIPLPEGHTGIRKLFCQALMIQRHLPFCGAIENNILKLQWSCNSNFKL